MRSPPSSPSSPTFFSSQEKTSPEEKQTLLRDCKLHKSFYQDLAALKAQEQILLAAADKDGIGSRAERKHVVIKALIDNLDGHILVFNKKDTPYDSGNDHKDLISLMTAFKDGIKSLLHSDCYHTLNLQRSQSKSQASAAVSIVTDAAGLATLIAGPVGWFAGAAAFFFGGPIVGNTVNKVTGLSDKKTATIHILEKFSKSLEEILKNLKTESDIHEVNKMQLPRSPSK